MGQIEPDTEIPRRIKFFIKGFLDESLNLTITSAVSNKELNILILNSKLIEIW